MAIQFPVVGGPVTPAAGQDLQLLQPPSAGKTYQITSIQVQTADATKTTLTLKDGPRPIRILRCANDGDGISLLYDDDTFYTTANGVYVNSSAAAPLVWTIEGREMG